MEHGNRLGIAGITSSPMPGVIHPEDRYSLLVLTTTVCSYSLMHEGFGDFLFNITILIIDTEHP